MGVMTLPAQPKDVQRAAMSRYVRALRYTNKMLANPAKAASDEALLVVILLGLYEVSSDPSIVFLGDRAGHD
jgi:hypothetical protein